MTKTKQPKRNVCPQCKAKGKRFDSVDQHFFWYRCPKGHEWVTH